MTSFGIYHLHLYSGAISLRGYLQNLVSSIYLKFLVFQILFTILEWNLHVNQVCLDCQDIFLAIQLHYQDR